MTNTCYIPPTQKPTSRRQLLVGVAASALSVSCKTHDTGTVTTKTAGSAVSAMAGMFDVTAKEATFVGCDYAALESRVCGLYGIPEKSLRLMYLYGGSPSSLSKFASKINKEAEARLSDKYRKAMNDWWERTVTAGLASYKCVDENWDGGTSIIEGEFEDITLTGRYKQIT